MVDRKSPEMYCAAVGNSEGEVEVYESFSRNRKKKSVNFHFNLYYIF